MDVRIFHNGPVEVYVNGSLAFEGSSSVGYRVAAANEAARSTVMPGIVNSVAVHCRQNTDQSFGAYIDVGLGRLTWR